MKEEIINKETPVIDAEVENEYAIKRKHKLVSLLVIIPIVLFVIFILFSTYRKYWLSDIHNINIPEFTETKKEVDTLTPEILNDEINWTKPKLIANNSSSMKPLISLFGLTSDDSLKIFEVGSIINGKYKKMTLYSFYYGQGFLSSQSGASGTPVMRIGFDKTNDNYVIFANSSCDLLPPFNDWQNDTRNIKKLLDSNDVDITKLPNSIQVEWKVLNGIPNRTTCGFDSKTIVNGLGINVKGPFEPIIKMDMEKYETVSEIQNLSGVKLLKYRISNNPDSFGYERVYTGSENTSKEYSIKQNAPKIMDYSDIYIGLGKDGSIYYVKQFVDFESIKYSKMPISRFGEVLKNESNLYGESMMTNGDLEIDQDNLEQVGSDSAGNKFYAIKSESTLADSLYKSRGSMVDKNSDTITKNEFIRCFPLLFVKNILGDIQVYFSGYAFGEIPEYFSTGRAYYLPNIFESKN